MIASDIHFEDHQDAPRFEYDRVDGGTLVYVVESDGRRLHGFADVTDWDAVRSELVRRGHDVGAVHHLPNIDHGA
jgi:hypothetical protein